MIVINVSEELKTEQAKIDWLAYWRYFSIVKNNFCSEVNCLNSQDYGALVKKSDDKSLYVLPLCKKHSDNILKQIEILDSAEMISVEFTL
ncbi:hypothetical protein [Photobacterium carnosum]|uniref:hypothetical protein n=1 Tax=Photobacterium carnosum TaxID=2023717 RepID=UPI001E60B6CF|nr:hypothetical protein [Photobacterium carnosum]MCD9515618.1 hypothetical protein [Photobacterium carnosum]